MKYDFTTLMDRHGKDAIALDHIPIPDAQIRTGFSRIPMWVADMNFPTAPSVVNAIAKRIAHPAFGYFDIRDEYYDAVINWHKTRNGIQDLTRACIGYENGVLGGLISAVRVLAEDGAKILIHTPAYIGFTGCLTNNGYHIVHSPLIRDEKGIWRMDFDDMEQKLREEKIHDAVFCSPHNPCGRVWEQWEIEKAMDVFRRNDCYVISDEIWSDLLLDGHRHIPAYSVSEDAKMRTVTLYAPSKTFNLAGLIGAYHIIYNPYLRDRVEKQSSLSHYNSCNVLSMHALIGAYSPEGAEWVDELRQVLSRNMEYACSYITTHFKGVSFAKPEGTYMLFLDCEAWCRSHNKTIDALQRAGIACGVIWQDGRSFGGAYSIRMNLALPFSLVEEAMERLDRFVFSGGTE